MGLYFALQTPSFQSWLAHRVTSYLEGQLGTKVSIGKVDIDLWAHLIIEDLYIEDQHQDTLVFIPKLAVKGYTLDRKKGVFQIDELELNKPFINLKRYEQDTVMNLAFITDYINSFSSGDTTSAPMIIEVGNMKLNDARFNYTNEHRKPRGVFGFDWNYIQTSQLNIDIEAFSSIGDTIKANIKDLAGNDISGFKLEEFSSDFIGIGGDLHLNNSSIKTNDSHLIGDLAFLFEEESDLDNFEEQVEMNHNFDHTELQLGDLAYFVSDLEGVNKKIILTGNVKGTVDALKGKKVEIQFDENSFFKGDFDMDGLPNIDETFISLDIKELTSNKTELERIPLPPFTSSRKLETPANFAVLGQMKYSGNFTGFINDFVSFGVLSTAIGSVSSDMSFREIPNQNDYEYSGNLGMAEFDLSKFYNDQTLGPLSANMEVSGSGLTLDKLDLEFDGEITALELNGYRYTNIQSAGHFRERFFEGDVFINDPNADVNFTGQINFREKKPILDFYADIQHIDMKAVHLLTQYEYSSLSGAIEVNSQGLDFANFVGDIRIYDLTYCAKSKDYYLENIKLSARREGELKINLESDVASLKVNGDFDLVELAPSIEEIISEIVPSYNPPERKHKTQNFNLELVVHDFNPVSEVFLPELKIDPDTRLKLDVNEDSSLFELTLTSNEITYQGNTLYGAVADVSKPDSSLYLTLSSDNLKLVNGLEMVNMAIDARNEADTIYTAVVWGDETTTHSGDFNGKIRVRGYENIDFVMGRSNLMVNNQKWTLNRGAKISIDSTRYEIRNFSIFSGNQSLAVDGVVSQDDSDKLNVDINAFDLSFINPFVGGDPSFHGIMSGNASVRDVYGDFIFVNDIAIIDLQLNDHKLGDLCLESAWDNPMRRLVLEGQLENKKIYPLSFKGFYKVDDADSPIDIQAHLEDLDLAFINEFMADGVLDIEGLVTGDISITGKPESPQLEGEAALKNAAIFVDYLNTKYFIEEEVGIYPDMFTFDHIRIRDQEGNPGFLTGQIMHQAFGEWNFDIIIDLESRMLTMNTNEQLNSLYYGKAYTTGYASIYGYDNQLEFDINLRTEEGTSLAMPMSSNEEVQFGSFIRFIQTDTLNLDDQPLDLSGIKMKFDLEITPDAQFEIIFDQAVGDVMSGRGKGHINMEINNLSTFNMFGTVEVERGQYLFTLKNMINKEFSVRPGGTISWFGDPFAADLNLKAVYKVSASLNDVLPDALNQSGQRVPVDLVMNLTGKMMNPQVMFDIELPTVDEVTKSRVQSVISTDQERNRQAFALLVMRRFVSPPNINRESSIGNAFAENSSELLSSQISNWLSQISDDFNLGFNYRPGDEISNEEIALALSTQLFNERLLVNSNVGVSRGTSANQNPSNLIGDIRLEYKMTPDGKIRLVVYNESNDFRMITTQQSPYTQGVGVLYQEEFNTMNEFYCGFKNLFRKESDRVKCD